MVMKCTSCLKRPAMSIKYQYCNTCVSGFYRKHASQPSEGVSEALTNDVAPQTPPNKVEPLQAQESDNNMTTKNKATIREVSPYVSGTNELLDRIHDGETIWIVQGNKGRRPVIADTEEDARRDYLSIDSALEEEDELV